MKASVLESIKLDFEKVPKSERSVKLWNEIRCELKKNVDQKVISELDALGFIHKWLYE